MNRIVNRASLAAAAVLLLATLGRAEGPAAPPTVKELPLPAMTAGPPGPGKFVKQVAPEYRGTQVYHALYLPTDWAPGKLYPVIVEYAGNQYQPICTGKVEDCKLGYYQSGGHGFIWVVLPYISPDKKSNQLSWWGDLEATVDYCKTNVPRLCAQYGGDTSAVFITGFSRGAIACGYVGLHDDQIADLWLGFLPHSHHDGGSYTTQGARERLARIQGRASFLSWGGGGDSGKGNSLAGKAILDSLKFPVTTAEIPGLPHSDTWITKDCPARQEIRRWLAEVIRVKPGTHVISGQVTDGSGRGLEGVRIQSGPFHWTVTDAKGHYDLRGLVGDKRPVTAVKEGLTFRPDHLDVTLGGKDAADVNFSTAAPRPAK